MSEQIPPNMARVAFMQAALDASVIEISASLTGLSYQELECEISTEVAPRAALAALAILHEGGGKMPCLRPIGVGLVPARDEGHVRLSVLFESGATLPLEMTHEAAASLARALSGLLKE